MALLLADLGVIISKRQLVRLLIDDQDAFLHEARDVLAAGLDTASWITADDTGARHKGKNGVCTQIGNHAFTSFSTTGSKSRLNLTTAVGRVGCLKIERNRELPSLLGITLRVLREASPLTLSDQDLRPWTRLSKVRVCKGLALCRGSRGGAH